MANDNSRSIQVLNISNVNAQGKTVLNDGKLLELIQKYPFLYNPRVKAYNDNDYSAWAWKNINAAFNQSYANDPSAAFSTQDLINRWQILKPLIQCLSKAYDLEAIPQSLRSSVVNISAALENQCFAHVIKQNVVHNLLMEHMSFITGLPLEKRLSLEKDILDLLLATEFEARKCRQLDAAAWKEINQETEELLDEIGFKNVLQAAVNRRETIFFSNHSNQYSCTSYKDTSKWVKLNDAHKYIKPCHVRIPRINIEDYLPLSKIVQFSRKK